MFDIVLVGADDSSTARRAVEAAVALVELSHGTLHILTAFESKPFDASALPAEYKTIGQESGPDALLQSLSFIASTKGIEPVMHASKEDPGHALIKIAEEIDADLIVVGNRGMKGARRVLGSIPNSVAHGASCSVLIVDTTD
jgi:nucleotide-binding universal stress UspA family protein